MTLEYDAYCLADPVFYDIPGSSSAADMFGISRQPVPDRWRREIDPEWVHQIPIPCDLPAQGWKIHVSGRLDNAEDIIQAVWDYCTPRALPFKFLKGPRTVLARNGKYAGRGGSGKVVTVYPRDDGEREEVCRERDALLGGAPAPYILSALRWGAGPVHVRYGAFASRYTTDDRGELVPAIEDPSGTLVPDIRGPVFTVPPWVTPPECLAPHLEARRAVTVAELPYSIDEALHFSNGGGVYAGTDTRTGQPIVLKEARPHAGIAADGSDAVTRLHYERDVLERLAGIDAVPRLLDHFTVGEHEFIAMEHIDGEPLNKVLVQRYPLVDDVPDPAAVAEHPRWALALHADVTRAVDEIHARGVVYKGKR